MNFPPFVKAWIQLICLALGSGGMAGMGACFGGAKWWVGLLIGVFTGATNVYNALSDSPKDKAEKAATAAPFPTPKP